MQMQEQQRERIVDAGIGVEQHGSRFAVPTRHLGTLTHMTSNSDRPPFAARAVEK
jgi:hypothetical protein